MKQIPSASPLEFTEFGTFLKYLRRRAQLTQTELAIACGYSTPHISHLENNQRLPDQATLLALFVPALGLENEPELVARLLELAADARGERPSSAREASQATATPVPRPMPSTPEGRNRYAMLQNVRKFWIEGVLENSLYDATLIELGLKVPVGKVENPWETLLRKPGAQDEILPTGTRVLDIFDQLNGKLLILGDPGSGKTTTLLELARDLLSRADADSAHPIPIIFNLSSWSEERKPLVMWLVDELNSKYQSPKKVGQEWVENDGLLLLLDGLDEVAIEHRDACMRAINAYREEHGFVDIVICSRTADYEALSGQLRLNGAVVIQPLDDVRIDQYLSSLGPELATIRSMLDEDKTLLELSRSPLMLSILVLAYRGNSSQDLTTHDTPEAQRKHLFDVYVQRMFERRAIESLYTQQDTLHYLTWLAQSMTEHAQSVFQIEKMQPTLLTEKQRTSFYRQVRLISMISLAVLYGITNIPLGVALEIRWVIFSVLMALNGATFAWIFTGRHWHRVPILLLNGLTAGLAWGLGVGLAYNAERGFWVGAFAALIYLLGPFAASRIFKELGHDQNHIALPEVLHFSRVNVKPLIGLAGIVSGILAVLAVGWAFAGPSVDRVSLIFGLIGGGVIYGLSYAFQSGLSSGEVEHRIRPNQGIWASLSNANRAGIGNAAQFLLTGLFGLAPILGLFPGLMFGVSVGLSIGFTFWFIYGGLSVIQHVVLRRILQQTGTIPPKMAEFLNYATSLLFLRKIGGGYIFIHRYLLEYFAALKGS
jgi:transcriptional regulator with XRE-family HTH domain